MPDDKCDSSESIAQATAQEDVSLLATFLGSRDVPCPVCKYNVRNLMGKSCPECGSSLELRLGSSDLHIMPWVIGLLSAAIPAGFFLIVSLVMLYLSATQGAPGGSQANWMWWFYGLTALSCVGCALLVGFRRRFLKRQRSDQWTLAAITLLTCGGSVLVYMTLFILDNF